MRTGLFVAACALAAAGAVADRYEWSAHSGNFTIKSVYFNTRTGHWSPGDVATIIIEGVIPSKQIVAGTTRWELYEQGQPHKISQGSADYFQCTNKGCDTSKPLSLYLEHPHSVPTSFKIEFTDVIPSPSTSGDYTLVVWGYDQDHFPYDFSASIRFNATSSAAVAPAVAAQPAAPTPATESNARYTWRAENGNFTVALVNMYTASGAWKVGETAHVVVRGEIPSKRISAGTVKYQVWEYYVEHFVAQGNSPYFHCSNKGCDVTQPVALDMRYPASRPTGYQLRFDFSIPQPEKTGQYRVVVWGEDQDHTPYDFSLTLGFNTTSPLLF